LEKAADDTDFQEQLWSTCKADILFFTNCFLWVYEPREAVKLPWITWPFQDFTLLNMQRAIGNIDIGIEKSRDMGATWMFLLIFFHEWMFKDDRAFGVVSRTQDIVDKTGDPDCLFWKLDFMYSQLPQWMQPDRLRNKLTMVNKWTSSTIVGYAATDDIARGGRKTAFGMDEAASWGLDDGYNAWASTQSVTNCRISASTPAGNVGIFADTMRDPSAEMVKISLHWTQHPDKKRGMYTSNKETGKLDILDKSYDYPPDYQFVLDGKTRSPWYDRECRRHPVAQLIAQELDIDYSGSGFPFFSVQHIDQHSLKFACDPFKFGRLVYEPDGTDPCWQEVDTFELALWINLTVAGEPARNQDYAIGCDIATGSGGNDSTNSTACVYGINDRAKYAELAISTMLPHDFAVYVLALSNWFQGPNGPAIVGWEQNGPGGLFAKEFLDRRKERIYYREKEDKVTKQVTQIPGWWSDKAGKRRLLGEYGKAIQQNEICNRSKVALEEMTHYIHTSDGKVVHDRTQVTSDPTSANENHGDRVIADALANRILQNNGINIVREKDGDVSKNAIYGSMAWRHQQHLEHMRSQETLSDWM
jgi:hypothetical protein